MQDSLDCCGLHIVKGYAIPVSDYRVRRGGCRTCTIRAAASPYMRLSERGGCPNLPRSPPRCAFSNRMLGGCFVLSAGLLSGASAYYAHAPGTLPQVLRHQPSMWSGSPGLGGPDIYGFEEAALPPLPSGAWLVIEEMKADVEAASDDSEEEAMWRRIQRYVDDDDEVAAEIGGEVWPAATALCAWLANHTVGVQGTRVLELGAGTGVCGLYAAALGASHVLLTDGGSASLLELCERNVAANAPFFAPSTRVDIAPLRWGPESGVLAAEAADGGEGGGGGGAFEWILASDCSYGQESGCQHESLCQALRALLLVEHTSAGGSEETSSDNCCGGGGGGGGGGGATAAATSLPPPASAGGRLACISEEEGGGCEVVCGCEEGGACISLRTPRKAR